MTSITYSISDLIKPLEKDMTSFHRFQGDLIVFHRKHGTKETWIDVKIQSTMCSKEFSCLHIAFIIYSPKQISRGATTVGKNNMAVNWGGN